MAGTGLRLLTLILGIAWVCEANLLGAMHCTYGPAYWCGSLRNAKECSAVTHCIQSVWEKQTLPVDNDDICNICKDMVDQARTTLESNQTQEELKQVLEGSCNLIPLRDISHECIELVDNFIPELIETLASQMNPQVVCATAGLCNSVNVDLLLRDQAAVHNTVNQRLTNELQGSTNVAAASATATAVVAGKDCKDCKAFVADLVLTIHEKSEQELMDRLLVVCGDLGGISDSCSALVVDNIDDIYNFLTTQVHPDELCELFGMCSDLFVGAPRKPVVTSGDEGCDFCVVIAQHWRDVLTSNTTEEQFREILQGMCRQSGSFKDECLALVDSYYLAAYQWLVDEFKPKQLCELAGICSVTEEKPIWTVLHTGPDPNALLKENNVITDGRFQLVGQDEANSYKFERRQKHQQRLNIQINVAGESGVLPGGNEACTMCEFTLHFLQNELQEKSTRDEIEAAVKHVCAQLPHDLSEQCDDYVDAYGDQIIAMLEQEIDPSIICPMLGLCPSGTPPKNVVVTASRGSTSCIVCEFILFKLKEILANHTEQEKIRQALDHVCSSLPSSISHECQSFVDKNAVEVMRLIAGGVHPERVCSLLAFCPSKHRTADPLPALSPANQLPLSRLFAAAPAVGGSALESTGQTKVCILCEFTLSVIEQMILDNNTNFENDIEASVKFVCIHLPATLQDDCLGFVEQYGDALVELLIHHLSPSVVCQELTICRPPALIALTVARTVSHNVVRRSLPDEESLAVSDERRCLICKAVHSVGSSGDATVAADRVTALCASLPTVQEQQLCTQLQQQESSSVESDASARCVSLKLCPAVRPLLGAERCTWGPAYWCQSRLHAASCSATAHCEERVWSSARPDA